MNCMLEIRENDLLFVKTVFSENVKNDKNQYIFNFCGKKSVHGIKLATAVFVRTRLKKQVQKNSGKYLYQL